MQGEKLLVSQKQRPGISAFETHLSIQTHAAVKNLLGTGASLLSLFSLIYSDFDEIFSDAVFLRCSTHFVGEAQQTAPPNFKP